MLNQKYETNHTIFGLLTSDYRLITNNLRTSNFGLPT